MSGEMHIRFDDELDDWLDVLAKRPGSSKRAIVRDAVRAYRDRGAAPDIHPTVKARLDKLWQQLDLLQRDVHVLGETLALLVRYQMTVTSPPPDKDQAAARSLGKDRFLSFVAQVGRRIAQGKNFSEDVYQRVRDTAAADTDGKIQEAAE